jgi:hypothetical protein
MKIRFIFLVSLIIPLSGVTARTQTVYSQNAVGYVNIVLKPGFSLISNPLKAADNRIRTLFPGLPNNTRAYKFNGTTYDIATYTTALGWTGPAADLELLPGEGVFVSNPTSADVTVTMIGEVMQGSLTVDIPAGFSIKGFPIPMAGTTSQLQFPPAVNNITVYVWNAASQAYQVYLYTAALGWTPTAPPIDVGQGIFVRAPIHTFWTRTFSVNQ